MKPVQDQIYFFSGEDRAVLEKSPLVVGLVRRGYEVILCDDPIDEYVFNTLREYEKKVFFVNKVEYCQCRKGGFQDAGWWWVGEKET